jgi:hypothetical protein
MMGIKRTAKDARMSLKTKHRVSWQRLETGMLLITKELCSNSRNVVENKEPYPISPARAAR